MKKINLQKGSSTLEILIAFVILIFAITAVIVIGFGNQSVSADSETNNEALYKAKQILEDARVQSREDFNSLVSILNDDSTYGINYEGSLDIVDISPCLKQASSTVTWEISPLRTQTISIATFLGSVSESLSLGGDCNITGPEGDDWKKPSDLSYTGVALKTEGFGTGIDSHDNLVYLITSAAGNNKDDFYIFDLSDINSPIKLGHLDVTAGLEDIDVVDKYAFIANDENESSRQLIVINVSDELAPSIVASSTLPGILGNCPNTCPGGRSIYYYKNKVYLGLHRLAASGAAEFHIFNVINPESPSHIGSKGGTSLGDILDHNINDIYVRDQTFGGTQRTYAYLATSNNGGELTILNVTNPSSIPNPANTAETGSVLNLPGANAAGENLDATTLFVIGNRAYLGRDRSTNSATKDLFIIDISNPGNPTIIGQYFLGLNSNGSSAVGVIGIKVASNLAFVATSDPNKPFIVLNVANPSLITRWDLAACGIDFSTYATGMDYGNNQIYLSLHNAASNINFTIIKSSGGSC